MIGYEEVDGIERERERERGSLPFSFSRESPVSHTSQENTQL